MFIGFGLLALASINNTFTYAFEVSLVAIGLLGISSALGESTMLGFCKGFPSYYVGYFSSGSGISGIFAGSLIVSMKYFGATISHIYVFFLPTAFLYYYCFKYLNKLHLKFPHL